MARKKGDSALHNNKRRLQFDFTREAVEEFEALQEQTGLTTKAELIKHAVRWLQWTMASVVEDGGTLLIEKEGKTREVVFPFWGFSSKKTKRSPRSPTDP